MGDCFRFKRFVVGQGGVAMKVGTDGVLLGAWCTVAEPMRRVLDIGTGTGLIALMAAQRGEGFLREVHGIDIDANGCRRAMENAAARPWNDMVHIFEGPVQEFCVGEECRKYDLIVSNPPYFSGSLLPPDDGRAMARHTAGLTHGELIRCASELLLPGGYFAVIIPYELADPFIRTAVTAGLLPARRTDVFTTPGSGPKRTMLEFVLSVGLYDPWSVEYDTLVIENSPLDYTEQYRKLTGDFYLKF